jgi:hypothetical protein
MEPRGYDVQGVESASAMARFDVHDGEQYAAPVGDRLDRAPTRAQRG